MSTPYDVKPGGHSTKITCPYVPGCPGCGIRACCPFTTCPLLHASAISRKRALIVELLHVYCPIRTTLNPAHTTQQLRVLTYPGVRVVVSVSMVTLVVVVGLVVVLSSAVCLYSGVCGGGVRGRSVSRCTCVLNICHKQLN